MFLNPEWDSRVFKKRRLFKIWKLLNVNFSKGAYLVLKYPIVFQETRLKTLQCISQCICDVLQLSALWCQSSLSILNTRTNWFKSDMIRHHEFIRGMDPWGLGVLRIRPFSEFSIFECCESKTCKNAKLWKWPQMVLP